MTEEHERPVTFVGGPLSSKGINTVDLRGIQEVKIPEGLVEKVEKQGSIGAAFYPLYYAALKETCKEHGYALTCHGSMKRDLDLVAIPWTKEASDEETLIKALIKNHELLIGASDQKDKPHGRAAYVFVFFGDERNGYIDLSVMPLKNNP